MSHRRRLQTSLIHFHCEGTLISSFPSGKRSNLTDEGSVPSADNDAVAFTANDQGGVEDLPTDDSECRLASAARNTPDFLLRHYALESP